jgi:hypothetical protein
MVQNTPLFSLPYVESADTVTAYPATSQQLAVNTETALTRAMTVTYGIQAMSADHTLTGTDVVVATTTLAAVPYKRIILAGANFRRARANAGVSSFFARAGTSTGLFYADKAVDTAAGNLTCQVIAPPFLIAANATCVVNMSGAGAGTVTANGSYVWWFAVAAV